MERRRARTSPVVPRGALALAGAALLLLLPRPASPAVRPTCYLPTPSSHAPALHAPAGGGSRPAARLTGRGPRPTAVFRQTTPEVDPDRGPGDGSPAAVREGPVRGRRPAWLPRLAPPWASLSTLSLRVLFCSWLR